MTRTLLALLFLFAGQNTTTPGTVPPKAGPETANGTGERDGPIFETIALFPTNTQFSIALVQGDQVEFVGVENGKNGITKIENHDRVFEIGSISKVFTATLLATFVLDGTLLLTDAIAGPLGLALHNDQQLTFLELANHTSGLPRMAPNWGVGPNYDANDPYKDYHEAHLIAYLTELMELREKEYAYSNLGAAILGYSLTKVGNKPYGTLMEERIFSTYRMNNSSTVRKALEDKLAPGLDENGNQIPNWDMSVHVGAGGILSSAEDLSKFAMAQFNNANAELVLTRDRTHRIDANQSVGLGWHIVQDEGNGSVYVHNGGTGGYTSSISIDPTNKIGAIVLSNVSAYHEDHPAVIALCDVLFRTLDRPDALQKSPK